MKSKKDQYSKNKPIKLPDSAYWRYKKQTPPIDEFADKNGVVKIIKPKK